jgi:arylsulfatase A-like enzyme
MELLGQPIPLKVEGKSLVSMAKNPSLYGRDYVISAPPFANAGDTIQYVDNIPRPAGQATSATITTSEWALLYDPTPGFSKLFNLETDPNQEKDVIKEHPEKAKELHQMLVKFMRETNLAAPLIEARLKLSI